MQFEGALIKEQNVTFALVVVKSQVLNTTHLADAARRSFSPFFPSVPIILMAQDSRGTPTYQGRKDIVAFLAHVNLSQIPWKKYTYS